MLLFIRPSPKNLSFEVLLISSERMRERTLDRQVLLWQFSCGVEVRKVGFWNVSNPERGAYRKARLLDGGQVVSELEYNFAYGSSSAPKLQVNDLVPNSQGISVALSQRSLTLTLNTCL